MGLFSGIGKMLFGDPGKDIRRSSAAQLAFQREAFDYMKEIDKLPLQARNQALQALQGFYSGDPGAQQELISQVQESPFYQQMIQTGQEGVLDRAGAMGLTRSGNVAQDLSRSNQAVLQGLVGQRIGGLQGLAGLPLNTGNIANQLNMMGQNVGQAGIASAQAGQNLGGQVLSAGLGLAGLFSDVRLKENIKPLNRKLGGFDLYSWDWNDKAGELGLSGNSVGVLAQEVEESRPDLVFYDGEYRKVNYGALING